ncbi:uroporphyrinogen-III synthase [Croceitalea sp. MTPC9]|uniref:uroporphyrinogen-III synthase n=1 Tax=unclassified Croceitalea TaxID=2632280 RepID=UPI002B3E97B2|nr:uroporphyrinogen-III synthase [Croceitalea sp. MTPC6]GMN16472.1 uroporphyrinogen-III synthase [Croceitalea sp. MTPC9]
MSSILSTKILSPSQKELLLNANLSFVEYDAIKIEFLPFEIDNGYDYFVFTSQNGVNAFLKANNAIDFSANEVFCVGEKTRILLEQNHLRVVEMAQNSSELGTIIAKKYIKHSFLIFSGNLRRPELPQILLKNNIRYKETITYNTSLNFKVFQSNFNRVLFFSPSGVESFIKENGLGKSVAFCIGETTAAEAKKHTDQIIIANKPTVENVLVQAIKHHRNS